MGKRMTGQCAKLIYTIDGETPVEVAALREWSISVEQEKIDATAACDGWTRNLIGIKSWEGDGTCIDADPYWLDFIDEENVKIEFYDNEGDAEPKYVGTAIVDFERSTPYDDVIETSFTFTGNGELKRGDEVGA